MDSDEEYFYDAEGEFDEEDNQGPVESASQHASTPTVDAAAEPGGAAAAPDSNMESDPLAETQEPFPLHRACWYGQVALVRRLVAEMTREQLKAFDSQGNTPLHVAVMRRHAGVVSALLEAGCSAGSRNTRGWVPLMEAVELGEKALALQLAREEVAQMRSAVKAKKSAVLAKLRSELPDFSLQLKWELGSSVPGVGALVRRYAPHDTYTLWKKGGLIRVDGTLMGIDQDNSSVVPAWKRGNFSLLYDASGEKSRALIVNHTDKTYLDVKAARKKFGVPDGESRALETEVDLLMASEVLQQKKLRSVDFRFKPVAGWLTKEVKEKVEGWNCKLYEAGGRLVAVSRYKMPYGLTPNMSYDDYLAATFDPDPVVESPVNPMNPASYKDRGNNPAKAAAKLAVAARHQRIATAAAAAKDEQAARVATAAAARAAAGGLRALAPRIGDDDDDDDDDDDGEEGDKDAGRSNRSTGRGSRSASTGVGGTAADRGARAKDAGGGSGAEGVARVVASAEVGTSGRDGGAGAVAAADGGRVGAGINLAEVDLGALAAQAAAQAAEAQRAKEANGGNGDDDDDDDDDRDCCEGDSLELSTCSESPHGKTSDVKGTWGKGGEGRGGGRGASGKAGDAESGAGSSSAGTSGRAAVAAATATTASRPQGNGGGVGGSGRSSEKGWRGWGFGSKKGAGPGAASGTATAKGDSAASAATTAAAAKKSRKISGRCWMAESFPLSLKQLLPLLEVVGTANKAFAKVARFMQKYGDLAMFPVKVQVPLILTVYMMLSFKQFRLLGEGHGRTPAPPDDFFCLPPGYTEATLEKSCQDASATAAATGQDSGVASAALQANAAAVDQSPQPEAGDRDGAVSGAEDTGSKGGCSAGAGVSRNLTLLQRDLVDDDLGVGEGLGLGDLDD